MYLYASRFLSFNVQKNFHSSLKSYLISGPFSRFCCYYAIILRIIRLFQLNFIRNWYRSYFRRLVYIFISFLFLPFTIIFVIQLYSSVAIVWKYVCLAFHKTGRDLTHNVQLMWSLIFFILLSIHSHSSNLFIEWRSICNISFSRENFAQTEFFSDWIWKAMRKK